MMRYRSSTAAVVAGFALASSVALAQAPPGPKLPAMPSMDQKGSDDLSKPAGATRPPPLAAAPKPSGDGAKAKPPVAKPPVVKPQAAKPKEKPAAAKRAPAKSSHPIAKPPIAKPPIAKPRGGGHVPKGRPARKRA